MTTVGQILREARNHKKLTLEQAEKATKIRLKFLVALEGDEFTKLPPSTFTKGFIKNYAAYLSLPVEETLAFYRRQVNEEKLPAPAKQINQTFFRPSLTTISVSLLVLIFFTYLVYSYFRFAGSPTLTINSPANNTVVASDQIELTGKTDPDAVLTINDQNIPVNESGSFSVSITLQPGINTLTITSTNKFRRQTTITRSLRLEK